MAEPSSLCLCAQRGLRYVYILGLCAEEVGSYVTSLQFLLCQQYVHRRECMGKNKDVARTKQNEGQGCFVSK